MSITVHSAEPESASPLAGAVLSARRRDLPADGSVMLELAGRAALLYVQFGVLATGGRSGPRALPHEWLRVSDLDRLHYANASRTEPLCVYEIVFAGRTGQTPAGVEQRYFSDEERANHLCPVVSAEKSHRALALDMDVKVFVTTLGRWSTVLHDLPEGRAAWALMLDGDGTVNNQKLEKGAGATISDEDEVRISGGAGADVMLLEAACDSSNGNQ